MTDSAPIDAIVDLSHWQSGPAGPASPIDFAAMRPTGILAVILKATQGSAWVDATFVARCAAASAVGLLVGAYHFADASDPGCQAAHFLTIAGALPRLAIDIEPNGIGDTVSIAQAAELVARIHQASGRLPAVYIGRWGPTGDGAGLPNSVLSRCPLWLPAYGAHPSPPAGWENWTLWQYTDAGTAPGIGGRCDRSRFNGSADDLAAWWGQ
jgi:lysozyme